MTIDGNRIVPDRSTESNTHSSEHESGKLDDYREETKRADIAMSRAMSDFKVQVVRYGFPTVLTVLSLLILSFVIVMGVHYFGHPLWRWLDPPDIARIEGALGGVTLAGAWYAVNKLRQG